MNMNTWNSQFLIISSHTLPEQSGSGIHAFRFCQYLIRYGQTAQLLTFNRQLKWTKKANIVEGVKIVRIPYFNRNMTLKIMSLPVILLYYCYYIVKSRVIFLYGNKIIAYKLIILMSYILRRKIVFQSLLPGVDDFDTIIKGNNRFYKKLNLYIFKRISVYFSINKMFTESYKKYFSTTPLLFNSVQGVNTDLFKPASQLDKENLRNQFGFPTNKTILICPGLIIKRKGLASLFSELSALKMDFLLLVIGEFDTNKSFLPLLEKKEMTELKALGEKELRDKIFFTGAVSNIHKYMQIADLMVFNSENEGMPNVILEAMATGLPILCKEISGVTNYIVQHNYNAIVYKSDAEINRHIINLSINLSKRQELSLNARNFALQNLSFNKVVPQLIELL
jgi:glycosyltransferase involved in cell wall biosynthesis